MEPEEKLPADEELAVVPAPEAAETVSDDDTDEEQYLRFEMNGSSSLRQAFFLTANFFNSQNPQRVSAEGFEG